MRKKPAVSHSRLWIFGVSTIMLIFLSIYLILNLRRSHFYNHDWRTGIVFNTDPVVVLSVPPKKSDPFVLVTIPSQVYVTVPNGYGPYRMEAVWRLSELEKNDSLVLDTVSDLLGVSTHGIVTDSEKVLLEDTDSSLLLDNLKSAYIRPLIMGHLNTNLSFFDRLWLSKVLYSLKNDSLVVFATHKSQLLFETARLVDGTEVRIVNETALDTFLEQKFEDDLIREENISIRVVNATTTARVGFKFARFLTSIGAHIIALDSKPQTVDGCQVLAPESLRAKKIIVFLEKEFNCTFNSQEDISGVEVEVVVGESYGERWSLTEKLIIDLPNIQSEEDSASESASVSPSP